MQNSGFSHSVATSSAINFDLPFSHQRRLISSRAFRAAAPALISDSNTAPNAAASAFAAARMLTRAAHTAADASPSAAAPQTQPAPPQVLTTMAPVEVCDDETTVIDAESITTEIDSSCWESTEVASSEVPNVLQGDDATTVLDVEFSSDDTTVIDGMSEETPAISLVSGSWGTTETASGGEDAALDEDDSADGPPAALVSPSTSQVLPALSPCF